jgi:nuclear pore complex protein Nup188
LSVLSVGTCLDYIQDPPAHIVPSADAPNDAPYILNCKTIPQIHNMLMDMAENLPAAASPMVLGWSVILQRIRLRVEEQRLTQEGLNEEFLSLDRGSSDDNQMLVKPDPYEGTIMEINQGPVDDPIQQLALTAVDGCHVFETLSHLALQLGDISHSHFSNEIGAKMRIVILDLIRGSSAVGYIPEVLLAALSALTGGQSYWDFADAQHLRRENDPLSMFLDNDELVSHLLISSRARYPFESLPFLKLTRALAACTTCYGVEGSKSIIDFLDRIPSFTHILSDQFSAYETTHEEDNNNSIRLTRSFPLFKSRLRTVHGQQDQTALLKVDQDLCIAAGTYGRMVSESNPRVAYWFHEYSGFKYFGKLLETFLSSGDLLDATVGDIADRDSVAEIIGIFATLLLSISKASRDHPSSRDEGFRILEIASSGLSRNRDITSLIFEIFEEELQKQSNSFGSEVPLEVLTSCVHYIHALTPFTPGRVWPLVGRSGLLDVGSGGSKLSSIVGSVELVSGHHDFLLSCTRLFEALVEDFMINAINRRARGKSSGRFGHEEMPGTGVPDQVLSKVLLSFVRYLTDVFEGCCTWKFINEDDCRRLSKTIAKTFDRILHYTYGLDTSLPISNASESTTKLSETKLMGALESAALHIADSFLSTSSGSLRFQPFLHAFYDGFNTPDSTFFFNESRLCTEQVTAILSFAKTILRTGILLERPPSQLQSQLFKISPLLARLYVVDDAYRIPVIAIFETLVVSASNNSAEPPSLLGNLGTRTSKSFLHALSDVDKPLEREDNFVTIMHFVSMVVSGRQQWFANYTLTGRSSTDSLKSKSCGKDSDSFDRPLLNTALEVLLAIGKTPKREVLAALEFVALAQNFWPWATYDSEKHADFIKSISETVGTLKPIQPSTTLESSIDACYQTRIAAYAAEILAMNLFHSRQTGGKFATKDLISNLSYFTRFAVAVPQYNSSLHGNLKRNFEARYGGCRLSDFQRTSLETRELGPDYFYDLPLADKMLSFDPAWSKPQGFRSEVANANVNLALVDAQIVGDIWLFLADATNLL